MKLGVHAVGFGERPADEILRALAAEQIRRVGLLMAQVELASPAATEVAAAQEGVEILTLTRAIAFDLQDRSTWRAGQDQLRACLDAAARLSAPFVYTTTGPAPSLTWHEAATRFVEAVGPVADHARSVGVRLAVENTMSLRADLGFVHRLGDAVDLARLAGVGVIADLFAAWTERDLEQVLRSSLDAIAYVQVADFVLGTLCAPGRAVPGDGDIPIGRQLSWLRDAGYDGVIELELLGPRIEAEGIARANRRGLDVIRALL